MADDVGDTPNPGRTQTSCPKCQREHRPGESACPRCGLAFARWGGFKLVLPSHPIVDAGWVELRKAWESDDAHRRFLELAAANDGLDVAAALYREHRRGNPTDTRAETGVKKAATMAATLYQIRRGPLVHRNYPVLRLVGWMGAGAVLLGLMWAVWQVLFRGHHPIS